MNPNSSNKVTRSSLACLPCRSRHLKCDGQKPSCTRCTEASQECLYARSRRGGLDRATLAERRRRLAAEEMVVFTESRDHNAESDASANEPTKSLIIPPIPDIENDSLLDQYYQNFHKFHPFVLPKRYFIKVYRQRGASFKPLMAVMRFIGYLYDEKKWSAAFDDFVVLSFREASSLSPNDPILVQCGILHSIALFWHNFKDEAKREMDAAVELALRLGMARREFVSRERDPVIAESWRRTWWSLFIVDAYYAGTLGAMNFATMNVEATVDLPCEEAEYEDGNVPPSKTLDQFSNREFALDDTTLSFSSFAYLIGAVQCTALAISTAPKVIAAKDASTRVTQAADAVIDAWLLLLPKERKPVLTRTGQVDELMFQAHLVIHVATIGLHRPLSDLRFNAIESVSSCAREPPTETPSHDLVNVHTVRVLRSVEAQIGLLTLPIHQSSLFHHTPFATCMISEGSLALLSACRFFYGSSSIELSVARSQIRTIIGCLRALGETWPRTARNVREIQTVARHVLGVESLTARSVDFPVPPLTDVPSLSNSEEQGREMLSSESGQFSSDDDVLAALGSMDSICGWTNASDFGLDMSWLEH